jgi:1-acyl-sn-glycerol-3-phosphate acyltransferase
MQRSDRKGAFEVYDEIAAKVKNGLCVVVFPEGTRSRSYALGPFKKGPFVLAISAGAPVIPLVVHGTREVMPKGAWRVRANTVHVHLLPPVETAGHGYEFRHELTRTVWERITETLRDVYGEGSIGDADASARLERLA